MLQVGLTGNIASGKSSVVRVWAGLGAAVIDADLLARQAVEPGTPGLRRVAEAFGPAVLDAEGRLDRARLRQVVFRDAEARARLEAILHPEVGRLRAEAVARLRAGGAGIVVHDIPLLFEVGLEDEFDLVVLVVAPAAERLRRLVEERGLAEEEARRMIEAQRPDAETRPRADLVIDNAGTLAELEARAAEVWREIERRAELAGARS